MAVSSSEEHVLVTELSRAIVARVAPEESDLFDELLQEYFANPQPPDLAPGHTDDPLGFGLGDVMLAVTPAAAAVASAALRFMDRVAPGEDNKAAIRTQVLQGAREERPRVALTREQLQELREIASTTAGRYGMDPGKAEEMANAILVTLMIGPSPMADATGSVATHREPAAMTSIGLQLRAARDNLRLIEERKSQYVLSVEIPLQLMREEHRLRQQIEELERQMSAAC